MPDCCVDENLYLSQVKKWLSFLLILPGILQAQTGDIPFQAGAISAAMGGSQTAVVNEWATHSNPGLLPLIEKPTFAIGTENRFLLSALGSYGLTAVVPLKTGAVGMAITTFGYSQFQRSRLGLSYGLKLSEAISAGVNIHYDRLVIGQNYGSAGALSATMGLTARVNEDFQLGAFVFNPFRVQFSEFVDEYIPTVLGIGGAYSFSKKVVFAADIEKDINNKPGLKLGIEYKPDEVFFIRAGFRTQPQSYTFGFGVLMKAIKLDMAAWMHPVLGFSPNVSLRYELN